MGATLSMQHELKPLFLPYTERSVDDVKYIIARFEEFQTRFGRDSFGFHGDYDCFRHMMGYAPGSGAEEFTGFDGEEYGTIDMNEVISVLIMCCKGPFRQKASLMFSYFDFDESGNITIDELQSMILTLVNGVSRACGNPLPDTEVVREEAIKILRAADSLEKDQRLDRMEWEMWTESSPPAVYLLSKYGTIDSKEVRKAFLKAQSQSSSQLVCNSYSPFAIRRMTEMQAKERQSTKGFQVKFKPESIRRLKSMFDFLDEDGKGRVDVIEMQAEMRVRNLRTNYDLTNCGKAWISFFDVLGVLFPGCTQTDKEEMLKVVCRKEVTPDVVKRIKKTFDSADEDFSGRVPLRVLVPILQRSKRLAAYVDVEPITKQELLLSVDLPALLERLFSNTNHHQLHQIHEWGRPSKPLSPDQLKELCDLFHYYDSDNSGTISLGELREAFVRMGFDINSSDEMMAYCDEDNSREITIREFQSFYRELWGSKVDFETESFTQGRRMRV